MAAVVTVVLLLIFGGLVYGMQALANRFQLVAPQPGDWAVALAMAALGPALLLFRRLLAGPPPAARRSLLGLAPGLALYAGLLGGVLLLCANALLDTGIPQVYAGTIASAECGRSESWQVRTAAPLPGAGRMVTISGAGCGSFRGDSVTITIKPGWFGRPWIAAYHHQTYEDWLAESLKRHRAQVGVP